MNPNKTEESAAQGKSLDTLFCPRFTAIGHDDEDEENEEKEEVIVAETERKPDRGSDVFDPCAEGPSSATMYGSEDHAAKDEEEKTTQAEKAQGRRGRVLDPSTEELRPRASRDLRPRGRRKQHRSRSRSQHHPRKRSRSRERKDEQPKRRNDQGHD